MTEAQRERLAREKSGPELLEMLHPSNRANPVPAGRYNLVVLGAGSGGLVAAAGAAGLGAKVALIESHLMGGDCLNYGCVPSKALLASARAVGAIQRAKSMGIRIAGTPEVDFNAVMQRMRDVQLHISPNDSVQRFQQELGVDVYLGKGHFAGPHTIDVNGRRLEFVKAIIATGARPALPPIQGLENVDYLTNETVFHLTELPHRLAVLGGGPLGCEMAQLFQRLGAQVTLLEKSTRILPKDDTDAAGTIRTVFAEDGIEVLENATVTRFERAGESTRVVYEQSGHEFHCDADKVLLALGRIPNVENIGLERAGVAYDTNRGVHVNDRFRTSRKSIFAIGDCCMTLKFTHAADAAARIAIQNALFWGRKKNSALLIPWATYTDPEVAHVGLTEAQARQDAVEVDVYKQAFSDTDRGTAEGERHGFVKILTRRHSDRIVGATIVAEHAGDMIGEIVLAMSTKTGLGKIAGVIHPYPTRAESIRHLGDEYNRTRLTPFIRGLFRRILAWQR